MEKTKRSVLELALVVLIAATIFYLTFQQMSMDGILPGNDPAVHLGKTQNIIQDGRVTYDEGGWYPPLFHTFLSVLLLFSGTLDVLVASLVMKLVVASTGVLIVVSTYLLSRKLLGKGVAICSICFIGVSTPFFEITHWGGYPNFLGLAFINLIFYIMAKKWQSTAKIFLLFLLTFAIILTHHLVSFVFVLLLMPIVLITSRKNKRQFLAFFAIVLASGLAILAWYAEILLRYSSIVISHLFFEMEQYTEVLPLVSFQGFVKAFGASIFLAVAGIPLVFILTLRKRRWRNGALVVIWTFIPFVLSQSYFLGIYLPYERFIYFLITPVAILTGNTVYSIVQLPACIQHKLSKEKPKGKNLSITKLLSVIILIIVLSVQGFLSYQRVKGFPEYYEVSGVTGYNTGHWLKNHSLPNSTAVVSEKPGAWLHVVSNLNTIEEINPIFERNKVAETVLQLFYEMENSYTLVREQVIKRNAGQEVYISIHNLWREVLVIPDESIYVIYQEGETEQASIPMSETKKEIYWGQKSNLESELICRYVHPLFTLKKIVILRGDTLKVDVEWRLKVHQNLADVKLRVSTFTSPSLNFTEAFIPGISNWQNPWEAPTYFKKNTWAVIEGSPNENITALYDGDNNVLMIWEYGKIPDWLNVGALSNRQLDAVRVRYEIGDMKEGKSREISFSIFSFYLNHSEKLWNSTVLREFLDYRKKLAVEERDYLNYIEKNNIKFLVVHHTHLLPKSETPPILDRVYDTGEFITYKTES